MKNGVRIYEYTPGFCHAKQCVSDDVMAFGEVGLSGEVRSVSMPGKRINEAVKMGVKTIVLPESCLSSVEEIPAGVELIGVKGIREACDKVI